MFTLVFTMNPAVLCRFVGKHVWTNRIMETKEHDLNQSGASDQVAESADGTTGGFSVQ